MPKLLIKSEEEAAPSLTTTSSVLLPTTTPKLQIEMRQPATSASVSVDISLIALYKKYIEVSYTNCDVLKQMAIDAIKERLKSVIETELANLIAPEHRTQIGQN